MLVDRVSSRFGALYSRSKETQRKEDLAAQRRKKPDDQERRSLESQ